MNHKFHVGERVRVVKPEGNYNTVGLTGVVISVDERRVGVRHERRFPGSHRLGGLIDTLEGLWYYSPDIQLAPFHQCRDLSESELSEVL